MACEGLKEKFDRYAGEDGLLDLEEFKKMIANEVKNERIKERVLKRAQKCMGKKDKDKDNKLSFEEFQNCSCLVKKLTDKEKKGECLDNDSD